MTLSHEQSFENYNHYHKSISIDMKGNDLFIKYTEVMILDQLLSEELISPSFHKLNLQKRLNTWYIPGTSQDLSPKLINKLDLIKTVTSEAAVRGLSPTGTRQPLENASFGLGIVASGYACHENAAPFDCP